jgi:hypothetical protein
MEAMKCFPPTRHRTEKSGSKQPELRRIRQGRSTTTRHQVLTTASQSSLPACPVTSGTRTAAGSALARQVTYRPPPAKDHTLRAGSSTARTDPASPTTGRRASHSAGQAQDRKPQQQVSHRPPPTATDHRRPAAGPASSPCTASRSPPPSHPSQPVALLPRQILLGVATDCRWTVSLDAACRG